MLYLCPKCEQHSITASECSYCQHKPNTSSSPILNNPAKHLLWGALLTGCLKNNYVEPEIMALYGGPPVEDETPPLLHDLKDMDDDGFENDVDCDDTDPNTHPGAAEMESTTECMTDADGDGFGAKISVGASGHDCDDTDALSFPGSEDCPKMFVPEEVPTPLYGVAPDIRE